MPLWNEVTEIKSPMRFQIPRVYSEYDISEFGSVTVKITHQEFIEWFKNLETQLCKDFPSYDTRITGDGIMNIKCVSGFSQYFDSDKNLIFEDNPPSLRNCNLDCLVDVSSYGPFNGRYGISIKLYQVCIHRVPNECLL